MERPRSLLQSYLTTAYRVYGARRSERLELRVNVREPRLTLLLHRHRARSAAFITAWHPRSRPRPRGMNEAAQKRLIAELKRLGCIVLPGEGIGTDGQWREPSVLALRLDRKNAKRLAHRYRQNAVLVCDRRGIPQLVLLADLLRHGPADRADQPGAPA